MKYSLLLLLPLFFLPLASFGQGKISQIKQANWDSEKKHWFYLRKETWDYDKKDREVLYQYSDQLFSPYNPINNISKVSVYNEAGQLIQVKEKGSGPNFSLSNSYKKVIDYSFDTQGELIESMMTTNETNNDETNISFSKSSFEKSNNWNSFKIFRSQASPTNLILREERDSLYNDNGCLIETNITYYKEDGELNKNWKVTSNYDEACNLIYRESSRIPSNSTGPYSKHFIGYSDDKKISYDTIHKINNVAEWNITQIFEIEKDSEGREIRHFSRRFDAGYIDTIQAFRTYTDDGKRETYKKYQTRYGVSDELLRPYQRDSFAYHYEDDNLILLEKFTRHYDNPATLHTIEYEYYCNGQLKKEISSNNNQPSQLKEYYYHGGVNCPLEKTDPPLLLYPNPTCGTFIVHSNLLMAPEVTIQVFSILGQEVFSKKISQPTYQYEVTLPTDMKGSFLVLVSTDEEKYSERVVIF